MSKATLCSPSIMGAMAAIMHVPQLRATGRAEIVAACQRDPRKLAMARKALGIPETYTDWRDMVQRAPLDAVVASTPHRLRAEPPIAPSELGLHALVEKPMALSSRGAEAVYPRARVDEFRMGTFGAYRAGRQVSPGLKPG